MSPTKIVLGVSCGVLIAFTFWFDSLYGQSENSARKQPASTQTITETATGLVPEVDAAVRAFLATRFGTIEKPVFHKDLPIDFGVVDASKNVSLVGNGKRDKPRTGLAVRPVTGKRETEPARRRSR